MKRALQSGPVAFDILAVLGAAVLAAAAVSSPALADGSGGVQAPPAPASSAADASISAGAVSPAGADASSAVSSSGGGLAPSASLTGGSEYGVSTPAVVPKRPMVSELSVSTTATSGRPPRVTLQITERHVGTVDVRVTVSNLATRKPVITFSMGWVHTGRSLTVRWPREATLSPGRYQLSISAHDHHAGTLMRTAHSSGEASLTVSAPAPPTAAPEAGVPTPAETAADGAVFPVAGAHNFGGPENRFGAQRDGYLHQGQDVLTAEGTPDVAPLAGTILKTSYQAGGAGYYAVEHTAIGFDFFFAHCRAASLVVSTGQAVAPGQALCEAGQTGDATAPHLDFEMWVGGWQASTGHPIDPLPYLEAWEDDGSTG